MKTAKYLAALGLAILFVSPARAEDAVDQAQRLLQQGQPQVAFATLAPFADQAAGNPRFDLAYGQAALGAGENTIAVFAFERVLEADAGNHAALEGLAQAHMALGEFEAARAEFSQLGGGGSGRAAEYIARIDHILAGGEPRVAGWLQLGGGYDSNVNSATEKNQIIVPAFAGLGLATLNPAATSQSEGFADLSGGLSYRAPFTRQTSWQVAADVAQRLNSQSDQFNTRIINGSASLYHAYLSGDRVAATLNGQFYEVDNRAFRRAGGLTLQGQHPFAEGGLLSGYAQYTRLDYPGQSVRDADRGVLGVSYAQGFMGKWLPVGYVGAYGGEEWERASNASHIGFTLWGLRAGGSLDFGGGMGLDGQLTYESRDHGGIEPLFLTTRQDDQFDADVTFNWQLEPQVTLSPYIHYTNNDSNIVLFDFGRWVAGANLRWSFDTPVADLGW